MTIIRQIITIVLENQKGREKSFIDMSLQQIYKSIITTGKLGANLCKASIKIKLTFKSMQAVEYRYAGNPFPTNFLNQNITTKILYKYIRANQVKSER